MDRAPVSLCLLVLLAACACSRHSPDATPASVAPADASPPVSVDASPDAAPAIAYPDDLPVSDMPDAIARARSRFPGRRMVAQRGIVLVAGDPAAPVDAAAEIARDSLEAFFDGTRFVHRPPYTVTAVVFSSADTFKAYGSHGNLGAYDRATHELSFDASFGKLTTLTHELVHAIVASDFEHAPLWFDECLASTFEAPVFPEDGGIEGRLKDQRLEPAQDAIRHGARLDTFFGMMNGTFTADVLRNENLVRHVCLWLDARKHLLWPLYRAWRNAWQDDRIGEDTFTKVVGESPAAANTEWREWVLALR